MNSSMQHPAFVDNETFYQLDKSKSGMEQLIGMTENLKKIHQLADCNYGSFEDMIASYLNAGIEIFQMETGIVSHITGDKQYIVKDVISPLTVIKAGAVYDLNDTYCREVYKTKRVIGLPHVGEINEMQGHPVYQSLKLEAYLSAPIYVQGKLYGTLNFTSTAEREYGFSEHEVDLISLMANSIGNFILLQEKESSLVRLNKRMTELVGYVSHDLRNPLGVIGNLAQIVSNVDIDSERREQLLSRIKTNADRCLELVNAILDIAALGAGKIALEKAPFNIVKTVEESLGNYEALATEHSIEVSKEMPKNLIFVGDEARLLQAFNNLINNAIKYAPAHSKIEITCIEEENKKLRFVLEGFKSQESTKSIQKEGK